MPSVAALPYTVKQLLSSLTQVTIKEESLLKSPSLPAGLFSLAKRLVGEVTREGTASESPDERDIARQQARLASLFGEELTRCAVCGELIFAEETLPCDGVENCAAGGRR